MRCGFCGYAFEPSEGKQGCGGCNGGCHSIHCPRCGYKNPLEPGLLKMMKRLINGTKEQ